MMLRNSPARYGLISQALHWLTALLVIALLISGKAGDVDADRPQSAMFMWHGSLGTLVVILVAARILWSLVSPAPPLPRTTTRLGRSLAGAMHVSLSVLLLAQPLTGWLAASAEGSSINLFGVVSLPRWDLSRGPASTVPAAGAVERHSSGREEREEVFEEMHELIADALIILVSLHALAALKHQFHDRDGLLARMLPGAGGRGEGSSGRASS